MIIRGGYANYSQLNRKEKTIIMKILKNNSFYLETEIQADIVEYCVALLKVDRSTVYRYIKECTNGVNLRQKSSRKPEHYGFTVRSPLLVSATLG